jgi:hypothetical protein
MKDYLKDLGFFRRLFIYGSVIYGFVNWACGLTKLDLMGSVLSSFISIVILFTIIYLMDKFNLFEKIIKFLFK